MATGLTEDVREMLVKAAAAPQAETRRIALRALLMFTPPDKVEEVQKRQRRTVGVEAAKAGERRKTGQ
jgi:hypothetical protein